MATSRGGRVDAFDVSHLVVDEAERELLAGVLANMDENPATVRRIVEHLSPEMLHGDTTSPLFAICYAVIRDVAEPSRLDVLARMRREGYGQGDDVHILFIDTLEEYGPLPNATARRALEAVDKIRENHERRQAVHAAELVVRSGGDTADLAGLIRQLEQVRSAARGAGGDRPLTLVDAVQAWAKHDCPPVVSTGLGWFDNPTEGGFPVGGITALVALPNAGKSPFALQTTLAAMIRDSTLRAVWGLGEMTLQAMARRTACVASTLLDGCEPVTMRDAGNRTAAARAANEALCNEIGDRLAIVPAPLTVERIEERVVATGARLVVIDYLQLIRGGDASDRVQELEQIIGRIRDLAITRECAVVCISSMARAAGASARIGSCAKGATEIDYAVELLYLGEADDGGRNVTWRCMKARNLERRDLSLDFDGETQTFGVRGIEEFVRYA